MIIIFAAFLTLFYRYENNCYTYYTIFSVEKQGGEGFTATKKDRPGGKTIDDAPKYFTPFTVLYERAFTKQGFLLFNEVGVVYYAAGVDGAFSVYHS